MPSAERRRVHRLSSCTDGLAGTLLTDLCAIGALAAALHSGVTPPALMVGYGMTTLAAVTMVLGLATGKIR